MNHEAVNRIAPATPGQLNLLCYYLFAELYMIVNIYVNPIALFNFCVKKTCLHFCFVFYDYSISAMK